MIQDNDSVEKFIYIVALLRAIEWVFEKIKKLYNTIRKPGKHEKKS